MTDNEKERSTAKVSDNFEKDKILASRYSDYFNHYIKSSKKLSMAIVNEEKAISENDSIGISEKEVYKFSNTQRLRKEQDELSDYNEEEISKAIERDYFMDAEGAKDFGIVDLVMTRK